MDEKLLSRTEGDGMESSLAPNDLSVISAASLPSTSAVTRTVTATPTSLQKLKLNEHQKASSYSKLVPKSLNGLNPVQPPGLLSSPFATGEKKLKFVPYEPYKGAVKPIIPYSKKKTPKKTSLEALNPPRNQNTSLTTTDPEVLQSSEAKIQVLTQERDSAQYELKIQTQVNAELKKLLVASVGEDMEARVQFLTEDKAKLAHDVRQYAQRMACDFEEKEKLSIEADVWRSKFLASSVLIEELARWKAILCRRSDDLAKIAMVLLDEMEEARQSNLEAYCQLLAVKEALDPLSVQSPKSREKTLSSTSILTTSSAISQLATTLKARILGNYNVCHEELQTSTFDHLPTLTKAQTLASQLLSDKPLSSCLMSDSTCTETTDKVTALAHLFSERLGKPGAFACCAHCSGEIKTV